MANRLPDGACECTGVVFFNENTRRCDRCLKQLPPATSCMSCGGELEPIRKDTDLCMSCRKNLVGAITRVTDRIHA